MSLGDTLEFSNWGWNTITISFLITVLFAVLEAAELLVQMLTIARKKKAVSIPVLFFNYFGMLLLAQGLYGLIGQKQVSLALICEGILGVFFYVPMWIVLYKHKRFSGHDWAALASGLPVLLAIFILPGEVKSYVLALYASLAVVAVGFWPYEFRKNRSRGQVEIGLLWVYALNVATWIVYGFAASILPIMLVAPFGELLLILAIVYWYKYPNLTKV